MIYRIFKSKYWLAVMFLLPTCLFAQNDELEASELEELIIQIEKIDSKWTRIFKKPKFSDWTESLIVLPDGHRIISKFTPQDTHRFNGISFLIVAPKLDDDNKIVRKFKPILFKITEQGDTLSLIGEKYIEKNQIKDRISAFELKKGSRLDFEFNHVIEVGIGETIYIGFEMIRDEVTSDTIRDVVWIGPCRGLDNSELETLILKSKLPDNALFHFRNEKIPQDIYFELKEVK